VVEKVLR